MRNNSFDLIRHVAALLVLVSHHFALTGSEGPGIAGYNSLGGIAVIAFFSISGLLITLSFLNANSFTDYLSKRIARIFPALIVCAFMMTFVAGAVFAEGYVTDSAALIDFLRISLFGRANIEEITEAFIFSESFNGSLWTLKIEFAFYLLVAVALGLFRRAATAAALLVTFCIATYVLGNAPVTALTQKLALYGCAGIAFFAGSLVAFYRQHLGARHRLVITLATCLGLIPLAAGTSLSGVVVTLCICLATLSLGLLYVDHTIRGRFDLSYGIYLYAFPVQQLVINKTSLAFVPSMIVSTLIVIVLAAASWIWIERPALQWVHRRSKARINQVMTPS
ncbi:acyltransferase [Pseudomonas sp. 91RF]|uniref:acyltransferase family protein n=1 Tax=Pseudomonas sp. 91RF TaxID=2292261 RepID=UPI000E66956F|nr:acyltransferase [Pseudomonas sp. 91RF]RIJ11036.1 acyltransferase [Pseudomonas sp. 91RF]